MDLSKREREGCRGYGGGHACGNAMMLVAMMLVVSGWRLEMIKKKNGNSIVMEIILMDFSRL